VRFDHFTITLLELRPDAPQLDDAAADELQNAHMAHLADLHDQGLLIAAGPLLGAPERTLRGLSIWTVPPEEAERRLAEHPDPAVTAGRFSVRVIPWMVPAGALRAGEGSFPRSVAEAMPDQ
jgi:uncharacterized protein